MNSKIELKYMPEKWLVYWKDNDGFEYKEMFDTKEEALEYKKKLVIDTSIEKPQY